MDQIAFGPPPSDVPWRASPDGVDDVDDETMRTDDEADQEAMEDVLNFAASHPSCQIDQADVTAPKTHEKPVIAKSHKAAFFDLDGTIANSNVVAQYVVAKCDQMTTFWKCLWLPLYALKCAFYLVVDWLSRSTFNALFARDFRGMSATRASKKKMAQIVYDKYMHDRVFPNAVAHVNALKEEDYKIVLVTGSLDFMIEPLARVLRADHVIANSLEETEGRYGKGTVFTGKLKGTPVADEEKRVRVMRYAEQHGIDLARSKAYGDSLSDAAMLECVGEAAVVSPSSAGMRRRAEEEGWEVLGWREEHERAGGALAGRAGAAA
uniref:HAD-IB family hydrolase n=1 Tax=Micromonas pusilla TaxID=38833 RepID=A0A7R9Y1U0_MICPS